MSMLTPEAVVRVLAESITESLGDHAKPRLAYRSAIFLSRQVGALIRLDPSCATAFREFVVRRVRPLVPDELALESVLTDTADPAHTYWLAIIPDVVLRTYVARKVAAPSDPMGPFRAMVMRIGEGPSPGDGEE